MSKPHFIKGRAYWLCYGQGYMGSGKTPERAYSSLQRKIEWGDYKARQREEARIHEEMVRQEKEKIVASLGSDPHGYRTLTATEFEEIHTRRVRYLRKFGRYPDREIVAGWVARLRVCEQEFLDRMPAQQ